MGVELEFLDAPVKKVGAELHKIREKFDHPLYIEDSHVASEVKGFKQAKLKNSSWKLIEDGSVSSTNDDGDEIGGEVVSPVLPISTDSFRQIQHAIRALHRSGADYSEKTGIHIHLDLYNIDRFVLLTMWGLLSDDIYLLFSDRISNRYASEMYKINHTTRSLEARQVLALILMNNGVEDLFGEKYSTLHIYDRDDDPKHPMGEFRVGQMEDNPYLMTAWLKSCCQLVIEASKFRDMMDFLYQNHSYNLKALNMRAPTALKWSRKEIDEISVYV